MTSVFGIETSSVHETYNHSTTPNFRDNFQMSWKL